MEAINSKSFNKGLILLKLGCTCHHEDSEGHTLRKSGVSWIFYPTGRNVNFVPAGHVLVTTHCSIVRKRSAFSSQPSENAFSESRRPSTDKKRRRAKVSLAPWRRLKTIYNLGLPVKRLFGFFQNFSAYFPKQAKIPYFQGFRTTRPDENFFQFRLAPPRGARKTPLGRRDVLYARTGGKNKMQPRNFAEIPRFYWEK